MTLTKIPDRRKYTQFTQKVKHTIWNTFFYLKYFSLECFKF